MEGTFPQPIHSAWLTVSICILAHGCGCHMEVMAASPPLMQLSSSRSILNLPLCDCALALHIVGQRFMLLRKCTNIGLLLLICPLVNMLPTVNYVFGELSSLKEYDHSHCIASCRRIKCFYFILLKAETLLVNEYFSYSEIYLK